MEEGRKVLRRISTGSALGGVCTGLADWSNIDVSFYRLVFVIGTIFTVFPFILTYLILWVIVPQK